MKNLLKVFQLERDDKMSRKYEFNGCWIQGSHIDYGDGDELYYQEHPNTIVRKVFSINEVKNAKIHIGCLGDYILYMNGKRVGLDELNHDWTNHKMCVYYETYDISQFVRLGQNEIIIELGNGRYNPAPLKLFGKYNLRETLYEVGDPKVICDVIVNDKVILSSDYTWEYAEGQLLFNNLYLGETVDLRRQINNFKPVISLENTKNLIPSFIPKIQRCQEVKDYRIIEKNNYFIVDFKEMISGFIHIKYQGNDGQKIQLQYAENMVNNEIDFSTSLVGSVGEIMPNGFVVSGGKGAPKQGIQTDILISMDGINEYTNKFTYHSFRYVKIEGIQSCDICQLDAIYVHTNLKQIGYVKTDNEILNELYDVAMRTKLNNVHSTFEDCARERLGYGGDMVALATSNLYTFDLESFYKKIALDFRFDQTERGGLPETAPYMGIQSNGTAQGEGPLLWQLVYPYLIYKRYQYYGDKDFIIQEYPYLKKHIDYIVNYDLDDLVHKCLGDHGSVLIAGQFRKPTPDKVLLGYCTVLLLLKYNIKLGNIIGKDTSLYQEKYNEIKELTVHQFMNKDGSFGEGTQSGYAFAIKLELSEPKALCKKFVDKIKKDNYIFNSGIFGMALSYEVLNRYHYNEVIEKWLFNNEKCTYLNMIQNGNKALAELFLGDYLSNNHAMFSSYQQWYYQGLAGIQIEENAIAFNHVRLSPYFSKEVNEMNCSIETKQGTIQSNWKRENNIIEWSIILPQSINYEIVLSDENKKALENKQLIIHKR